MKRTKKALALALSAVMLLAVILFREWGILWKRDHFLRYDYPQP